MSGNVNVGFIDGRVHNRVLKPPGGGYSEIFFTSIEEDIPKKAPPARSESLIESILRTEEANVQVQKTSSSSTSTTVTTDSNGEVVKHLEELTINTEDNEIKQEPEQEQEEEKKIEEPKTPEPKVESVPTTPEPKTPTAESTPRKRVPPGGYSSGLW